MIHSQLSGMLNQFLRDAEATIRLLEDSERVETGNDLDSDEDAGLHNFMLSCTRNSRSYHANMESANKVNQLRNFAQSINTKCFEQPAVGLLAKCRVQHLRNDFCGDEIKKNEDAEWEAGCCERLSGRPSQRTANEIRYTLIKVRDVHREARIMYYYLNPDKEPSCCCVVQ